MIHTETGTDKVLVRIGNKMEALKEISAELRRRTTEKRSYFFGELPKNPTPAEKIKGATPGELGRLEDLVDCTACILKEIIDIMADIDRA